MGLERVCRGLVKCPGACPGDLYWLGRLASDGSVVVGAICGEKRQLTSDQAEAARSEGAVIDHDDAGFTCAGYLDYTGSPGYVE